MRTLLLWIGLPITVGASAYAVASFVRHAGPVVEAPTTIELGTQQYNSTVEAGFEVCNRGRSDLELFGFRSSCNCIGIASGADGTQSLTRVTVRPDESFPVKVRFSVPAGKSSRFLGQVFFSTNDAARPDVVVRLNADIQGQWTASPDSVLLGALAPGQILHRTVRLRYTGSSKPVIARVECNIPEFVHVESIRQSQGEGGSQRTLPGSAAGEVEIRVASPANSTTLRGSLFVYSEHDTRPLLTIPVEGDVLPSVQFFPASIRLPRMTSTGKTYSVKCMCRNPDSKPFRLAVGCVPEHLVVRIDTPSQDERTSHMFTVTWDRDKDPLTSGPDTKDICFTASVGGKTEDFKVAVLCSNAE